MRCLEGTLGRRHVPGRCLRLLGNFRVEGLALDMGLGFGTLLVVLPKPALS